jgi:biotin carboxyl carrier protein
MADQEPMADHELHVARRGDPAERDALDAPRDAVARRADHAAIARLAEELLPSLIAKLGATGLGEIEVREGDWKVRLRRPADANDPQYGRRATDRPSRAQPGHAGHGHAPGAVEPRSRSGGTSPGGGTGPGRALTPVGPGPATPSGGPTAPVTGDDSHRVVATSPAVGVFQPRREITAGTRVRAGDRIGIVDVLGVPQEVVAPADGVIGASYVQAGEAVEYGQELVRIELAGSRPIEPPAETVAGASATVAPGVPATGVSAAGAAATGARGAEEA